MKRSCLFAAVFVAATVLPFAVRASTTPTTGSYAPVSGIVYTAVSDNKMLYLGTDKGMLVVDVSNKKNPRFKGMLSTHREPYNSIVHGIAISGNYVYADLREYGGLAVIDVSDPTHPTIVGSYFAGDHVWFDNIKVVGDRAYLYGSTSLIDVVDIADPTHPALLQRLNLEAAYNGLDVVGTTLYATNFAGAYELAHNQMGTLDIYNIADLTNPVRLSSTSMLNLAAGVAVQDTIAYIDDGDYLTDVDVSNPASPVIIGHAKKANGWSFSVTLIEHYVVLGSGEIFDVTNPAKPVTATSKITGNDHYTYSPAGMVGSEALSSITDIKDTAHPIVVSSVHTDILISDVVYDPTMSVAYAIDPVIGLHILDTRPEFQDVGYMYLVDLYDTKGAPQRIRYNSGKLFIATDGAGLQVIDPHVVLNAGQYESTPKLVGSYTGSNSVWDLDFSGHYAMLAAGTDGLIVIDTSSSTYTKVGQYSGDFNARSIEVNGNIAYLGLKGGGIIAVDISDPAHPIRYGSMTTNDTLSLSVKGKYLYTTNTVGMSVYSLSNPKKPRMLKTVTIAGTKHNVLVSSKNRAYVADGSRGVIVYNVSNPAKIKKLKTITITGMNATGLSLKGGSLIVAGGKGGVRIIDISGI